jgi:hypothetical protein
MTTDIDTIEALHDNDIVFKHGAARMFGLDEGDATSRVNYFMSIGTIPDYDFYIGSRGAWRRSTLRLARENAIKEGGTPKAPPRKKARA